MNSLLKLIALLLLAIFTPSAFAINIATTDSLTTAQQIHSTTLQPNGKTSVTAEATDRTALCSSELYDQTSNTWSPACAIATTCHDYSATRLINSICREPKFCDVPTKLSDAGDTTHVSIFANAGNDLTELGQKATTPDFLRSMLLIGGIGLGFSILDKPLDKLAVKHGNDVGMTKVETFGNALPFVAMAYAGVMYLSSAQDSKLANASYSSLAAGGEGIMVSLALKYMVGRTRPSADQGSANFTPISVSNNDSSWPSFHSTVMWGAITPYAKAYDATWLYGVAAVTNMARVAGRNHWFSDTVVGSLLGYTIGDFVWESHKNKKHGVEWVVSPNGVTAYWKIE